MKKILLLSIALFLPIGIFLFLKCFGKNKFEVMPLFQQEVSVNIGCDIEYATPYRVADSVYAEYRNDGTKFLVVHFADTLRTPTFNHYTKKFASDSVGFVQVTTENSFLTDDAAKQGHLVSHDVFTFERGCIFLLDKSNNLALMDINGTIFGQYNSRELEDMDRFEAELLILLKRY